MVIAAAEATGSVLAQLLQELAFNKPVQEQILSEMHTLSEDVADSEYVQSCVMEGFRLFAPATLVQRVAVCDTELPGGVSIPAGTVVAVCVTAVHRNPALFHD